MDDRELPELRRKPRPDIAQHQGTDAQRNGWQNTEPIREATGRDTADAESKHRHGEGQRGIRPGGPELGLHHGQHDHHRPHADTAERADQQRKAEPPPGGR